MTYCVKWIWFILLNFAKNKEVSKRNQSVHASDLNQCLSMVQESATSPSVETHGKLEICYFTLLCFSPL